MSKISSFAYILIKQTHQIILYLTYSQQLMSHQQQQKNKKQVITCIRDFEKIASKKLTTHTIGYYSAGADTQFTLHNNIKAFNKIFLRPRVLRDISKISFKTTILGHQLQLPFGIAPVAMQKLIHPKGQLLTAQEAYKQKTAYGLSMCSTTKPSEVKAVNPSGLLIQQLYLLKSAQYTGQFLKMFQKLGYHALALTVDTQTFGKRRPDERNKFLPVVQLQVFNELGVNIKFRSQDPSQSFIKNLNNDVSWESVKQLKKMTKLKIILKGVVDPADAMMADSIGIDAIWISNHGGRQLDTAPATIQALPPIKKALKSINSKMEIYIDGGVKKGTDIFKCLALGADFVFLGRGFLYSIVEGEEGISKSFEILKNELRIAMGLCGVTRIEDITENYVKTKEPYSKL